MGSLLEHVGGHFGVVFGFHWGHFRVALGYFGVTFGSFWGSLLGHFGVAVGSRLGVTCVVILGSLFVVTLLSLLGPPKGLPVSSKNKLDHSARLIPESYPIHARLIQALTWIEGDGWGVVGVWL